MAKKMRYPANDPENGPAEPVPEFGPEKWEEPDQYQARMQAAHELMAHINQMQAAIYRMWQFNNRMWDNGDKVGSTLIDLYHQADETLMALKKGTNVAHYG